MGTRTPLFAAASVTTLFFLVGCAASPDANAELTLAETKASVQLLRNAAAERIDQAMVSDIRKTGDQSFPCGTVDDNPGGLVRQWQSNAEIVLVEGADRVSASAGLVQSFVDEGWTATEVSNDESFGQTDLFNASSPASMSVSSADQSVIAIIRLTVIGPCVTTGGPDSDEVTELG